MSQKVETYISCHSSILLFTNNKKFYLIQYIAWETTCQLKAQFSGESVTFWGSSVKVKLLHNFYISANEMYMGMLFLTNTKNVKAQTWPKSSMGRIIYSKSWMTQDLSKMLHLWESHISKIDEQKRFEKLNLIKIWFGLSEDMSITDHMC